MKQNKPFVVRFPVVRILRALVNAFDLILARHVCTLSVLCREQRGRIQEAQRETKGEKEKGRIEKGGGEEKIERKKTKGREEEREREREREWLGRNQFVNLEDG